MRRNLFGIRWLILSVPAVLIVASCGDTAEVSTDAAPDPSTTMAEAATGPLALVGTYDGVDCSYDGPETATLDTEINLTLVNDSADAVFLRLLLIPPDRTTDVEPLVGTDFDFSAGRTTFLNPTLYAEAGPFAESSAIAFLPAPGTFLVECALIEGAAPVHVWWLAELEVKP